MQPAKGIGGRGAVLMLDGKAGLDPKAYRNPRAAIHVFSAQVFGEEAVL